MHWILQDHTVHCKCLELPKYFIYHITLASLSHSHSLIALHDTAYFMCASRGRRRRSTLKKTHARGSVNSIKLGSIEFFTQRQSPHNRTNVKMGQTTQRVHPRPKTSFRYKSPIAAAAYVGLLRIQNHTDILYIGGKCQPLSLLPRGIVDKSRFNNRLRAF